MKKDSGALAQIENSMHGSLKSYVIGFILSITLTLIAFWITSEQLLSEWTLILTLVGLAIAQVMVQLLFFLHLGLDSRPPWNLITFLFMLAVMAIVVGGSLWIMYNLDYYMMVPS